MARSLAPAVLAAPYRWHFGDGTTALGHSVTHRYARAGVYRLTVAGYDRASARWFQFDAALLTIVPPGQVWQANLGYDALRTLDVAMPALGWLIDAALILLILAVIVRRRTRAG